MTLHNGTNGQTDRVRRNMRPPPREEGRITTVEERLPRGDPCPHLRLLRCTCTVRETNKFYMVVKPDTRKIFTRSRCTSLLRAPVSKMTYTVSSGTLNPSIPYHTQSTTNADVLSISL